MARTIAVRASGSSIKGHPGCDGASAARAQAGRRQPAPANRRTAARGCLHLGSLDRSPTTGPSCPAGNSRRGSADPPADAEQGLESRRRPNDRRCRTGPPTSLKSHESRRAAGAQEIGQALPRHRRRSFEGLAGGRNHGGERSGPHQIAGLTGGSEEGVVGCHIHLQIADHLGPGPARRRPPVAPGGDRRRRRDPPPSCPRRLCAHPLPPTGPR